MNTDDNKINNIPKLRDTKLDSLKFFLVCLVIIGHVVGPYKELMTNLILKDFIYLFHIPLFVYLSGYLSKNHRFTLWGGVETYLIFNILYVVALGGKYMQVLKGIFVPQWLMWYLFSLIIWRLIKSFIIDKCPFVRPIWWIVISILISLISGFIPVSYPLSFQRTCVFFPFFIIGLFTPIELFERLKRVNKIAAICVIIFSIIIVCVTKFDLSAVVSGSYFYPFYGENKFVSALYRLSFLIVSCSIGIMVIALCPNSKFMARQGKYSLVYYLYHGFFVIVLKLLIDKFILPINTFALLVYSGLIICFLLILTKSKVALFLINPLSMVLNKK